MIPSEARKTVQLDAGLSISGKPAYLVVGRLTRSHGVHGEMLMEVITDFPDRLKQGSTVYMGEEHLPQVIRSLRGHRYGLIIGFDAFHNPESVAVLRDQFVYVRSDDRPPLPTGEYYHHQLIGLNVRTLEQEELGRVTQILQTGANDVFVVNNSDGIQILIPNISEVVRRIDLQNGEIVVALIPGLLP